MANEFKIRKGLIVEGASGGTVVDVQGSQGQLFSVTDDLSGSIFAVSDISGVPILDVNSNGVSYFTGPVGIGVPSPSTPYYLQMTSGAGANGDCILGISADADGTTTQSSPKIVMGKNGNTNFFVIEMDDNHRTVFANTQGYYFESGNVGIGTTSPTADLHVQGSSATNVPIIRSGGFGNSGSKLELAETLSNGDMTYGFSFFNDGNSSNTLMIKAHNNSTTGTTAMTIGRTNALTTFSTVPVVGTRTAGDNSTYAASTAFVAAAVAAAPQGDITAVTAGDYLTGGGTSGNVTLNGDNTKLAHIVDSSNGSVNAGWITVAQASNTRKAGEIYVTDDESGDHSYIRIEWMRSYADSNFTVLNCGGHANRIQGVRVLEDTNDKTFGKKYLQVKVTVTSNYYVIVTAPGSIPTYGDFIAETPVLENSKTGYNIKGNTIEDLQNSSVGSEQGITSGGNIELNDDRVVFTKGDVLSLSAGGSTSGTDIVIDDGGSVIKLNSDTIARDEFRVSTATDGNGDDVFVANSNNGTFSLGDTQGLGNEAYVSGDSSNITIINNGANTLVADVNNNVSIPNGSLGVGVTTATNQLHVHTSDDDDYAIRIEGSTNNAAGIWTGLGIGGENNNTKSAIIFEDIGASYSRGKLHLCVNNELNQNNATPADAKLTISNDGNVGIGTSTPNAKLDVQGTQGQLFSVTDNLSGDIFSVADISGVPIMNVNSDGTSYFDGDVAVNKTSPDLTLDVNGEIGASGDGYYINGMAWALEMSSILTLGDWDGNGFETRIMDENSTEVLRVTDGKVGIGTTDPAGALEVKGAAPYIYISDTTETESGIIFRDIDAGMAQAAAIKFNSSDNKLKFYNNDTTAVRMTIDTAGNVGIGTTTPGDKLHVNGTVRSQAPTTSDWGLMSFNSAGSASSGLWFDNGDGELLLRDDSNNLNVRLRSDTSSYINGGNLGLGITGPEQKLHINSGRMLISNNTTPFYIKVNSNYKSWVHHISADDGYIFAPSTADGGQTWDWAKGTKIQVDGSVKSGNFILNSDERIKTKIKDLSRNNIDVNWKSFEIKGNEGEYRAGVIAQELEKSHPEFVNTDEKGFKSVKYIDLLIAKIAELEARLEKAGI